VDDDVQQQQLYKKLREKQLICLDVRFENVQRRHFAIAAGVYPF
jgi:hypothetical protein